MSKHRPNGGQLSLLLPITSFKPAREVPPTRAPQNVPAREVSYGTVMESLRRKGLTAPKK